VYIETESNSNSSSSSSYNQQPARTNTVKKLLVHNKRLILYHETPPLTTNLNTQKTAYT